MTTATLQALIVNNERRWLRAPLQHLFEQARPLMQNGALRLVGKEVRPEHSL